MSARDRGWDMSATAASSWRQGAGRRWSFRASRFLGLFGRDSDYVVPWCCIRRIGEDIILVDGPAPEWRVPRKKRGIFLGGEGGRPMVAPYDVLYFGAVENRGPITP